MDPPERWQKKYREAIDELDLRERQWTALEEQLRRLAGRLCIAARGQHERLDDSLGTLIGQLRRPLTSERLEPLLADLTVAVAALDEQRPATAPAIPAAAAPPVVRAAGPDTAEVLLRLLDRLEAQPETAELLPVLRQRLPPLDTPERQASAAIQVADWIEAQRQVLRQEKAEADRLLLQLSLRLEDITSYLRAEETERATAQADGRSFNQNLLTETEALYANLRQASDLPTLQRQVTQRLSAIDDHLRAYRAREEARSDAYRARTEALRDRVVELEGRMQVLSRSLQKTERRAYTDGLTGVANRQAYDDRIASELKSFQRDRRPRSIAAVDVDHFKTVNDQYGHQAGDRVLKVLAQHLSRRLRDSDFIARYGGEEFVLLMDDLNAAQALGITNKLRLAVEKLGFHFRQVPVSVTVSFGVTAFQEGDTPESLFERADRALYQAKKNGRNQCVAG